MIIIGNDLQYRAILLAQHAVVYWLLNIIITAFQPNRIHTVILGCRLYLPRHGCRLGLPILSGIYGKQRAVNRLLTGRAMIDLQSPETIKNPFPIYSDMRNDSPVCRVEPGGLWAISRFDDVAFALRRHDLFSSCASRSVIAPPWLSEDCRRHLAMVTEDPPHHYPIRKLVNNVFTKKNITQLAAFITALAQRLVKTLQPNQHIDFYEQFAYPYAGKIIGRITGTEDNQSIHDIRHWLSLITAITAERPDDHTIEAIEKTQRAQNRLFDQIISDRQRHPKADLVSDLIESQKNTPGITIDLLSNLLDVLTRGGFAPPTHILSNALIHLSSHPQLVQQLKDSPDLIPAFVDEVFRYYPSVHCLLRQATREIALHSHTIPKGAHVLMIVAAANRDSTQFTNPEKFDIHRKNNKNHLTFGFGPHRCVGEHIAKLELQIAIRALLDKFSVFECPEPDKLNWIPSFFIRGLYDLPITLRE